MAAAKSCIDCDPCGEAPRVRQARETMRQMQLPERVGSGLAWRLPLQAPGSARAAARAVVMVGVGALSARRVVVVPVEMRRARRWLRETAEDVAGDVAEDAAVAMLRDQQMARSSGVHVAVVQKMDAHSVADPAMWHVEGPDGLALRSEWLSP